MKKKGSCASKNSGVQTNSICVQQGLTVPIRDGSLLFGILKESVSGCTIITAQYVCQAQFSQSHTTSLQTIKKLIFRGPKPCCNLHLPGKNPPRVVPFIGKLPTQQGVGHLPNTGGKMMKICPYSQAPLAPRSI